MNILSNIIKKKIKTVLADYFSDSEHNPISIEISSDELALKNVYLNTPVLNKFLNELPFRLVEGAIATLNVRIPWSSLFASPVEVIISQVVIILEAKDPSVNPEELINRELVLQRLLNSLKSHFYKQIEVEEQQDNASFFNNIKNKIIDNVQIKLSDIAVQVTIPFGISKPIFELRIMELSLFTSDDKFESQVFFDRNNPQFHDAPISKVAKLEGLTFVIEDANTKLLEVNEETGKRSGEYKNVFKLNLKIEARIKSTKVADEHPKFWGRVMISMFKFALTERKLNHIFELLEVIEGFNRGLELFFNYYAQKPKVRLSNQDLDPGFRGVLARRWWLYCGTLVLKDIHVKKNQDAWNQIASQSSLKRNRNIRLPHFMLAQFKEPVRNLLEELIGKNWKVESLSNPTRVLDLETILFSVPEKQLQQLVNQTCQGLIEAERRKKKGISFLNKVLRKIGLQRDNAHVNEMVQIIKENVDKDESFEQVYTASIELNFKQMKVSLMTDYGSVFGLEAANFQAQVRKYEGELIAQVTFQTFRLYFKNNNVVHPFFYSNTADGNFIDGEVNMIDKGKTSSVDGKLNIRSTSCEIRKEMFDEVYLFLQNRKQRQGRYDQQLKLDGNGPGVQRALSADFEKTMRNMQTDIKFRVTMESITFKLILDSAAVRMVNVNTGRLRIKLSMMNSTRSYSYVAQIENMGIDYHMQSVKHVFLDLSLYMNATSDNNVSFKVYLVSQEVLVNIKSLLMLDMLNSLALFKERNLRAAPTAAPKVLKEFNVPYTMLTQDEWDTTELTESMFKPAKLAINKNKTFTITADLISVNTQSFSQVGLRYHKKFGKYVFRVNLSDI